MHPTQWSPTFSVYGDEEIYCSGKQFFPNACIVLFLSNGMTLQSKRSNWRKRLQHLGLGIKYDWTKSSSKGHRLSGLWKIFQISSGVRLAFYEFAKLTIIVPATNTWPERDGSVVKWVKRRQRRTIENGLLNALLHVSVNIPPEKSPELEQLISGVVEQYYERKRNTVRQIYVHRKISKTICMRTGKINIDEDNEDIVKIVEKMTEQDNKFIAANFDSDSDNAYSII